jgi:hypothetical protein
MFEFHFSLKCHLLLSWHLNLETGCMKGSPDLSFDAFITDRSGADEYECTVNLERTARKVDWDHELVRMMGHSMIMERPDCMARG